MLSTFFVNAGGLFYLSALLEKKNVKFVHLFCLKNNIVLSKKRAHISYNALCFNRRSRNSYFFLFVYHFLGLYRKIILKEYF